MDQNGLSSKRACVVVLGDWGRSPRMQYHALSLAENGFAVDVIAISGSAPHEAVRNNKLIKLHSLKKVPSFENYFPRLFVYILKVFWQSFFLFTLCFKLARPDIMLIQNPPSLPTLPVCWFVCLLRQTKFIIDFHNYGFSILALSTGKKNVLVKICRWCEKFFGRKSAHSLCVTQAMQEDLTKNWNIKSSVLYDCPPEIFHPINNKKKHDFFVEISENYPIFKNDSFLGDTNYTQFTVKEKNEVKMLDNRNPLIVSSTSWTEDEDFSILLKALEEYEKVAKSNQDLPKLYVVITGKGPQKTMYEKIIENKKLSSVSIVTMWLAAEQYPTILASADLGISLHCSSSNLDLPMKVVDMFGCGLPVCAYYYPCIRELVKENVNGLCFSDSHQLANQLMKLFKGFPKSFTELQLYRQNLRESPLLRWNSNWNKHVLPILNDLMR